MMRCHFVFVCTYVCMFICITTTQCKLQHKCSFECVHISKCLVGRGKTLPVQVAVGSSRMDARHVCTLDDVLALFRRFSAYFGISFLYRCIGTAKQHAPPLHRECYCTL